MKKINKIIIVVIGFSGLIGIIIFLTLTSTTSQTITTVGTMHCTSDEDSVQWKDCETNDTKAALFIISDDQIVITHTSENKKFTYNIEEKEPQIHLDQENVWSYIIVNDKGDAYNLIVNSTSKMITVVYLKDGKFEAFTYYIKTIL